MVGAREHVLHAAGGLYVIALLATTAASVGADNPLSQSVVVYAVGKAQPPTPDLYPAPSPTPPGSGNPL